MAHYRIVRDHFAGYEVQVWRWWFPFWVQPRTNTHCSVEGARRWAMNHAGHVVERLGSL